MAFMRHNNNRRHGNNPHRNRHQGQGYQGQNQQGGQRRPVNRINHVFESNGPDGRIRGTAQQIVEKYSTLARDAASSGDKVLSLNYLQHAEHYQRLLNEIMEENGIMEREREQLRQQQQQQPDVSGEAGDGFVADEQPSEQPRPQQQHQRPQRQPQPQQDDNALPNFLQVPITISEQTQAAPRRAARPPRDEQSGDDSAPRSARARRANPSAED